MKLKGILIIGLSCILTGTLPVFGEASQTAPELSQKHVSHTDLLYEGRTIADAYWAQLLGYACILPDEKNFIELNEPLEEPYEEGTVFEWSYIGELPNGYHVVYSYLWPKGAMGKFSTLSVIERRGNLLKVVDIIAGGDRHSRCILQDSWELKGYTLKYSQCLSSFDLLSYAIEKFPELQDIANEKSTEGLGSGEACYWGVGEFEVKLDINGKVQDRDLIVFTPAVGFATNSPGNVGDATEDTPHDKNLSALSMPAALEVATDRYLAAGIMDLTPLQFKELMQDALKYAKNK